MEQGMELRSAETNEKARWHAPGLPMDLIQQNVKEEPDVTKQDSSATSDFMETRKDTTYNEAQRRATMSI